MHIFEKFPQSWSQGPESVPCNDGIPILNRPQSYFSQVSFGNGTWFWFWIAVLIGILLISMFGFTPVSFADSALPGADASDKLEAAGTLLRLLDTALFKWGARIFAGICIMSSAWSLKEQRFGIAIICIVGALVFGTAPTWVRNIFAIGGGDSVFQN